MVVIVFLLGRPGSGKSQVARWIVEKSLDHSSSEEIYPWKTWEVIHITDYEILYGWFREAKQRGLLGQRFTASRHGGFAVKDFTILREALVEVNRKVLQEIKQPSGQKLILIEFARNTYDNWADIWSLFDPFIREEACFLFIQANIKVCKKRVRQRVRRLRGKDDTFVPGWIMEKYYQQDGLGSLQSIFPSDRIFKIENNDTWEYAWHQVTKCLYAFCSAKTPVSFNTEAQPYCTELAQMGTRVVVKEEEHISIEPPINTSPLNGEKNSALTPPRLATATPIS